MLLRRACNQIEDYHTHDNPTESKSINPSKSGKNKLMSYSIIIRRDKISIRDTKSNINVMHQLIN